MQLHHILLLEQALQNEYFIDAHMIEHAIQRYSSFNLIYLPFMFQGDVFVQKTSPFAQQQLQQAHEEPLAQDSRLFRIASPEDMILAKKEWWKLGGGVSIRQWKDILGIFEGMGTDLDYPYLRQTAQQ